MARKYTCVYFLLFLFSLVAVEGGGHSVQRDTNSLSEPVPASGQQRLLVLTVGYPNQTGSYTGAEWKNGMFAEWNNFFIAQSYNKLQYIVDVVTVDASGKPVINDPTARNYIPLPYNVSKYANEKYGWDFSSQWSLHTIVQHASSYLDSKGFSWKPYIQNDKIQNVVIMSAGYDYRYAEATEADPQNGFLLSTSYSGAAYTTAAGGILNSYTFCSEHTQLLNTVPVMAQIGQCAHEHGHALGIPDLYDRSLQSTGVGYFDLMGYGMYANNRPDGSRPVPLGAWSKNYIGWVSPTEIRNSTQVGLGPVSLSPGNVLIIYPDPKNNDYFYLVENKQAIDKWDANFKDQYGNGIVIWGVNLTTIMKYKGKNTINSHISTSTPTSPLSLGIVVMEKDRKQDMSSTNMSLNYGSFLDMWQVGEQFIADKNFSIAIMSFANQHYTIEVSYDGAIYMPDTIKSSSSLPPLPSFLSSLCLLIFFVYHYIM